MNKSITFITTSTFGIELDSMIPLIIEYSKQSKVQIICSNIFSFEKTLDEKFPIILENKNISILYLDDIFYLKFFPLNNKFFLKSIIRIYLKFSNLKKMRNYFDKSELIYASNYLNSNHNNRHDLVYKHAKESTAHFIGMPIISWTYWYQSYFFDFDYFLCSSINEYQDLKKIVNKTKLLNLGCPAYEKSYLDLYKDLNKSYTTNKANKTALFIMVNTTNPVYDNYTKVYEDVCSFIRFLETKKYNCLIKLHPTSQTIDIKNFKNVGILSNYFIPNSIESMSSQIDISISLLSTAILKCVAQNIVSITYLPNSLMDIFPKNHPVHGNLFEKIYFKKSDLKNCRVEDFTHVIKHPEEILSINENDQELKYNNFLKIFKPKNAAKNIIDYLNSKTNKYI